MNADMKIKTCPVCGVEKPLTVGHWPFRVYHGTSRFGYMCLMCKKSYTASPKGTQYGKDNDAHERHKESAKRSARTATAEISDTYARAILIDLGFEKNSITKEMIDIKRQQIIMRRIKHEFSCSEAN